MAQDNPASLSSDPGPVGRAERLRQSADDAARLARTLFITFLVIGLYIAITIASTTDVQLLKVAPVQLPLLDIGLPIVGFYAVVPWLFVLVHLNLLLQLYLLGRKLHAFNKAVELLEPADQREQRERLFPFPLSHMLAGHQHSPLVRALLAATVWSTVVILPLILLIWAEVRLLPYRDATVSWVQRVAVGIDLVGLWLFWPLIVTGDHLSRWWHGFFQSLAYHPLLGLWGRLRAGMRWIRPRTRLRRGALKRWRQVYTPGGQARAGRGLTVTTLAAFGLYGLLVTGVWADSVFRRALDLREAILVRGDPPAEVMAALREGDESERESALKRVLGLSLGGLDRRRDLRGANFQRAVFPNVDLRLARLDGANLEGAMLNGANLYGVDFENVRFSWVELRNADLYLIDLEGARLYGADLQNANLYGARLHNVILYGANLKKANLEGANLVGAEAGCILTSPSEGSERRCTDFSDANFWGATLTGADLERATMIGAKLEGACGTDVKMPEGYSVPPCQEDAVPQPSPLPPKEAPYAPRITVHQD